MLGKVSRWLGRLLWKLKLVRWLVFAAIMKVLARHPVKVVRWAWPRFKVKVRIDNMLANLGVGDPTATAQLIADDLIVGYGGSAVAGSPEEAFEALVTEFLNVLGEGQDPPVSVAAEDVEGVMVALGQRMLVEYPTSLG